MRCPENKLSSYFSHYKQRAKYMFMFTVAGSCRQKAKQIGLCTMVKGPINLEPNFLDSCAQGKEAICSLQQLGR